MDFVLNGVKPEKVMKYFEILTRIPRGSGNEKQVSDYLLGFGKDLGLETIQDEVNNIIIKKPATKGYENGASVILQGHMDIVCAKEEGLDFDFEKDSIEIYVDGDYIKTKGTTLGGDNGIALAMAMAILDSDDIPHPELTALFTTAEETGMDGVIGLQAGLVKGDILINIDSEEEGTALASCAGGVNSILHVPVKWEELSLENAMNISIRGLRGGHSGMEINKNRANAIKLIARIMEDLDEQFDIKMLSITGGEKMNAIAKLSDCSFAYDMKDEAGIVKVIEDFASVFANEFQTADPDIKVTTEKTKASGKAMDSKAQKAVIAAIRLIHNGVNSMSNDIPGLVESSNNIGVLECSEDGITITNAIRSSVKSIKEEMIARNAIISNLVGANHSLIADYPEWQYKVDSKIRDIMSETYKDMFNEDLKIDAIHAGLECGLLKEKVGDIDMISIGPNMHDVHTPQERVSISSTERVYNFLLEVLKRIK